MLRCITHGWHIPCDYTAIVPTQQWVCTRIMCPRSLTRCVPLKYSFYTPINAVLKNSDKNRARTIAGIIIKDQASLTRSSDILVSQGLAKIKIRLTTDHTASGLNSQSYSLAFSYPSIADALRHMTQGCYMCVADIRVYAQTSFSLRDTKFSAEWQAVMT